MAKAVSWADVVQCFADRSDPEDVIHRLAAEWAGRYGLPYSPLGPRCKIRRDQWTHHEVGAHLDRLAQMVPALITTTRPRRFGGALVLVDFGRGRIGQIDGRRRANWWRHVPGMYDVLIVEA